MREGNTYVRTKRGYSYPVCVICSYAAQRRYRKKNPTRNRDDLRAFRAAHPEYTKEASARYRKLHAAAIKARKAKALAERGDELRALWRARYRRRVDADRDGARERWRAEHWRNRSAKNMRRRRRRLFPTCWLGYHWAAAHFPKPAADDAVVEAVDVRREEDELAEA